MRKYWYYTYRTVESIGFGICYSDEEEFDLFAKIKYLQEEYSIKKNTIIVIDNWREISSEQYEKLNDYLNETRS